LSEAGGDAVDARVRISSLPRQATRREVQPVEDDVVAGGSVGGCEGAQEMDERLPKRRQTSNRDRPESNHTYLWLHISFMARTSTSTFTNQTW